MHPVPPGAQGGLSPASCPTRSTCASIPRAELAAQLLGNVGEVDPAELKKQRFRGVRQGTIVGKGGIEYTYDRYLRGRDGARRLQVDALGNFFGELTARAAIPMPGAQIKLSIDLGAAEGRPASAAHGIGAGATPTATRHAPARSSR